MFVSLKAIFWLYPDDPERESIETLPSDRRVPDFGGSEGGPGGGAASGLTNDVDGEVSRFLKKPLT